MANRRKYESYEMMDHTWQYIQDPIDMAAVSYGDIREDPNGDFIEVPYCTYSDYSGSTVERSNCRVFLEMFANEGNVWPIYGGYGTTGVLVRYSYYLENEEMRDVIDGLSDYPVIDEDDWSELEIEIENECWDSWIKYDLSRAMEEAGLTVPDDDKLYQIYRDAMEAANEYPIFEDPVSCYVHIDRLIEVMK